MASPKHPPWLRVKIANNAQFVRVRQLVRSHHLNTVCESASCPNIGECWGRGTATFMILGNRCTRNCRFCDVLPGRPLSPDNEEPQRVAEAVRILALKHVVLTSVTRDDLPDGGARMWAETVHRVRAANPACCIEVLIPDFQGNLAALDVVCAVGPDILGHNVETVPRLYPFVRPQANYQQTLNILRAAKSAGLMTKSGLMLGMGEWIKEVRTVMQDLRKVACDILTLGQYLRPSSDHVAVKRYWAPEEFQQLQEEGREMGFHHIEAGPLVRSSYHADQIRP